MSTNIIPPRSLDYRRLKSPLAVVAIALLIINAALTGFRTLVAGWMAQNPSAQNLLLLALGLVGGTIFYVVGQILWQGVTDRAEGKLRHDLLQAALAQPVHTLSAQSAGEILDRVDDDTAALGRLFRGTAWGASRIVFAAIPTWIVAGITWWPAWIIFPILALCTYWLIKAKLPVITQLKVKEEAAWTDHAAAFEEAVAARDDLRTNHGQAFAARRLAELSAVIHQRIGAVTAVESRIAVSSGLLLHAVLAGVALAGVWLTSRHTLGIGQLVTLFMATATLIGLVSEMVQQLPEIQEGLGAIIRVRQLLSVAPEPTGGLPVPPGALSLEFHNLTFSYDDAEGTTAPGSELTDDAVTPTPLGSELTDDAATPNPPGHHSTDDVAAAIGNLGVTASSGKRYALQNVTLTVPAGKTIALVGRTGSGKTTLASLLSRAVEPPEGTAFLGGVDLTELDLNGLRAKVGVVTQRTEILAGTLKQNITLFADLPDAVVTAAINQLGLTDWVADLPQGLDTPIGPGGTKFSAGEEQLVAFARLLVRDVQVVVLDEATARMDPLTEARVVAAASSLLQGRTGVIVAHRLATIGRADLVAVLDHGRVQQFGPQTALAAAPGPYRDLLAAANMGTIPDDAEAFTSGSGPIGTAAELPGVGLETANLPISAPDGFVKDPQEADTVVGASPMPLAGAQIGTAQIGTAQIGTAQIGTAQIGTAQIGTAQIGTARRQGAPTDRPEPPKGMGLMATIAHIWASHPQWGIVGVLGFNTAALLAAQGPLTGYLWGQTVQNLERGYPAYGLVALLAVLLLVSRLAWAYAIRVYPWWWIQSLLRMRANVMLGQTATHRLPPTPPGEVTARAMDGDRLVFYADRWFDFSAALLLAGVTAWLARSWLAGLMIIGIMAVSALVAVAGRPIAGKSATVASAARAQFGRVLVSALEATRTVKLAAQTGSVERYLAGVDARRIKAAIFEHRVRTVLDGIPILMSDTAAFIAWALYFTGTWNLATTLLVSSTAMGFVWYAIVAGAVITDAPGARSWQVATQQFAGGANIAALPAGLDLVRGTASPPVPDVRVPFHTLQLQDLTVRYDDDGTIGAADVNLTVSQGQVVLLLGQVGSGKSAVLAALAGLRTYDGTILWDGVPVGDPEVELRPGRVAYVSQIPRVVSGTIAQNIALDHGRPLTEPIAIAQMEVDVAEAGGLDALVGHRGVKLSGGQAQRLAFARALATGSQVLVADDISSALDAATELKLWQALKAHGQTVIGSTSKAAALALADQVVVMEAGSVVASGTWAELAPRYSHLAG